MQVTKIGIDLAKNVYQFQVHGVDANDMVVFNKPLRRLQVLPFLAELAPCLIGMEACASAHYWARELKKLGHTIRLMPAKDVMAYVKRGKNDAIDAAACCETVRRPTIRTVSVKTPEQQAQLMQHRVRELLIGQRTQPINAVPHKIAVGVTGRQICGQTLKQPRQVQDLPMRPAHGAWPGFAAEQLGQSRIDIALVRAFVLHDRPGPPRRSVLPLRTHRHHRAHRRFRATG
jgi:hypothetical protein